MTLRVVPITHREANAYVYRLHRHNKPTRGMIFCVAVTDGDNVRGVAIVGRPVGRMLQDGYTVEVLRVCTDGARNACSMLYGACRRAARELGYKRVITYTLPQEGGASLRAAGFAFDGDAGKPSRGWHDREDRCRRTVEPVGDDLVGGKWRWVAELGDTKRAATFRARLWLGVQLMKLAARVLGGVAEIDWQKPKPRKPGRRPRKP